MKSTSPSKFSGVQLKNISKFANNIKQKYQSLDANDKADLKLQGTLFTAAMGLVVGGASTGAVGVMATGVLNAGRTVWSISKTLSSDGADRNSNQVKTNLVAAGTNVPAIVEGVLMGGMDGAAIAISSGMVSLMYGKRANDYNQKSKADSKVISVNNKLFKDNPIVVKSIKTISAVQRSWSEFKGDVTENVDRLKNAKAYNSYTALGARMLADDVKNSFKDAVTISPKVISAKLVAENISNRGLSLKESFLNSSSASSNVTGAKIIAEKISVEKDKVASFIEKHDERVPAAVMVARGAIILPVNPVSGVLYMYAGLQMGISDSSPSIDNAMDDSKINNGVDNIRGGSNVDMQFN